MPEFIQNPRRSARAPVRCGAEVVSAHGAFEATTEDVGGHGCQLVSPRLVRKGEPVQLVLRHEEMEEPLRIAGRVAWASERSPWRLGIAYDETALEEGQAWFKQMLETIPGLAPYRRIPDRIPIDAIVYLATPPRFVVDFTADEVALLRGIGSGASVAELRAPMRDRWQQAQRALFSLLAHQHVTLSRGGSVHPDAWRRILSEAESSLAVESLRGAPVPDLTPSPKPLPNSPVAAPLPVRAAPPSRATVPAVPAVRPAAVPEPVRGSSWPVPLEPVPAAAPLAVPSSWPVPEATTGSASAGGGSEPPADWLVSAAEMMPAGWPAPAPPFRGPPSPVGTLAVDGSSSFDGAPPPLTGGFALPTARSPEAQGCYERGLAELGAGRLAGATALLRRALALAPGDPEISGALARVTQRGR